MYLNARELFLHNLKTATEYQENMVTNTQPLRQRATPSSTVCASDVSVVQVRRKGYSVASEAEKRKPPIAPSALMGICQLLLAFMMMMLCSRIHE